jgi:uncharacterized membrane protein YcaP (DUF421 family)
MDWHELFGLSVNPLELIVRGSAIFWFLFLIFRFVLRRDVGAIAVADVLLLVLVADAAQNAMAGEYRSITDGIVLVSTIIGWNYLIDWAAFRWSGVARMLEPGPLILVHHGRLLHRNLRRELMTDEDLMSKLREQGVDKLDDVRVARMEGDGQISVIKKESKKDSKARPKSTRPTGV